MPRLQKNPHEAEARKTIGAVMGELQINHRELSRITGIPYRTLMRRMEKIGTMKLCELWAIEDAARRRGYKNEKGKST